MFEPLTVDLGQLRRLDDLGITLDSASPSASASIELAATAGDWQQPPALDLSQLTATVNSYTRQVTSANPGSSPCVVGGWHSPAKIPIRFSRTDPAGSLGFTAILSIAVNRD